MTIQVGIINYKMGNIQSVANALSFLGHSPIVSDDPHKHLLADAYILPGVGAFGEAMKNLQHYGTTRFLETEILIHKKPILGICLGMQLMANHSNELGSHQGLGWVDAEVHAFPTDHHLRVPHVGWNNLETKTETPLFSHLDTNSHFYFDHSYYVACHDHKNILATCHYGTEMTVALRKENIFATQFHPEKSQNSGLKLLRNFLDYSESITQ